MSWIPTLTQQQLHEISLKLRARKILLEDKQDKKSGPHQPMGFCLNKKWHGRGWK